MDYSGVIDDQIDFIDCTGTKYDVTPLIIVSGKGVNQSFSNQILLSNIFQVHMKKRKSFSFTEQIQINNVQQGIILSFQFSSHSYSSSDTALNLAAHRKKYRIVDLLIQYHANPNISNQAGKTALHRAVVSYSDENINRIRTLLDVRGLKD